MSSLPVRSVLDFGAVGDGNPANAAVNTTAFQAAIDAVAASGGVVYVPACAGFVVNNGSLKITAPCTTMRGDSNMSSSWGIVSRIIGQGSGHTLAIPSTGGGAFIQGLAFEGSGQAGQDAFIEIEAPQVTISQCHFENPNIGISLQFAPQMGGEFWAENILMEGVFRTAGMWLNGGNAALQMSHILMYHYNANSDTQPPYGIAVTSCGELIISKSDIDNCGSNLALIPGMGGTKQQFVMGVKVSDSFFDNGNGPGNVLLLPMTDGFIGNADFVNVWTSTVNNNNGAWVTDGFHLDGSQTVPFLPGVRPIYGVTLTACMGQCMVNHCGAYLKKVHGASLVNCKFFGSNWAGVQLATGCTETSITACHIGDYSAPALGQTIGGNVTYGIVLEPNSGRVICNGNFWAGNGKGPLLNQQPGPGQIFLGNQ